MPPKKSIEPEIEDEGLGKVVSKAKDLIVRENTASASKVITALNKHMSVKFTSLEDEPEVSFMTSGTPVVDAVLGGGFARGKIVEVQGWESSSKTTLALTTTAACQRRGEVVAWFESERSIDKAYSRALGVDTKALLLNRPESFESMSLDVINTIKKAKEMNITLIVIDSLTSMIPLSLLDNPNVDEGGALGLKARLTNRLIENIKDDCDSSQCTVMLLNQMRAVIKLNPYLEGPAEKSTGGNSIRFYTCQRLGLKEVGNEQGEVMDELGQTHKVPIISKIKAVCIKNKVGNTKGRVGTYYVRFGTGIDSFITYIDIARGMKIIRETGKGYFSYPGEGCVGDTSLEWDVHGSGKLIDYLKTNTGAYDEMMEQINRRKALKE